MWTPRAARSPESARRVTTRPGPRCTSARNAWHGRCSRRSPAPCPPAPSCGSGVGDDGLWTALVERPLGERITEALRSDLVRGVVATDGLIGTLARLDDPSPAANRCFLYHVIGNGTGRWDVPVGGMGTVAGELERAARAAGTRIVTGAEVTAIDPAGRVTYTGRGEERTARGDRVLAGVAPWVLERLCPGACPGPKPVGAQVKVNLLLRRLPGTARPRGAGSVGLRRHPARQRDVRTARPRVHRGPARRDSRTAAVRGLLPLAHRPDDLLTRVGRVRRPRADRLRSAGPGPVADGERRRLARPARARRPRLAEVGARGARRGPAGHRCRRASLRGDPHDPRPGADPRHARWPHLPRRPGVALPRRRCAARHPRPAMGCGDRPLRASCSAAPVPCGAAGSAASVGTMPRWRCWRTSDQDGVSVTRASGPGKYTDSCPSCQRTR